jgi:hypothetical protein
MHTGCKIYGGSVINPAVTRTCLAPVLVATTDIAAAARVANRVLLAGRLVFCLSASDFAYAVAVSGAKHVVVDVNILAARPEVASEVTALGLTVTWVDGDLETVGLALLPGLGVFLTPAPEPLAQRMLRQVAVVLRSLLLPKPDWNAKSIGVFTINDDYWLLAGH